MKKLSILVFLAMVSFTVPSHAAGKPLPEDVQRLVGMTDFQVQMARLWIAQGYVEGLKRGYEYGLSGKKFDQRVETGYALEIADEIMADSPSNPRNK